MSEHPFFFTWSAQEHAKPQQIVGGQGARFRTADGGDWLDFASLSYQANLGHGNRRVAEAIKRQADEIRDERRSMVGQGERSEKIRTYNFPQNRVTDHRIGLTLHKLDRVIDGDLEELLQALVAWHQAERLKGDDAPQL